MDTYTKLDTHLACSDEKPSKTRSTREEIQRKYDEIASDRHTTPKNITSFLCDLEFDSVSRSSSRASKSRLPWTSRSSYISHIFKEIS